MMLPLPLVNAARALVRLFQEGIVNGATSPEIGTIVVAPTGFTAEQLAAGDADADGDGPLRAGVSTDIEILRAAAIFAALYGDWHQVGGLGEPAFQNLWSNADVAVYTRAGFKLDALANVELKGAVTGGSGVLFTLPNAYRPIREWSFPVLAGTTPIGKLAVKTTGAVELLAGNNTFVSLDGLRFSTLYA